MSCLRTQHGDPSEAIPKCNKISNLKDVIKFCPSDKLMRENVSLVIGTTVIYVLAEF